jgi:hypothetical protein
MKSVGGGARGAGFFACCVCATGCANETAVSSSELGVLQQPLVRAEPSPRGGQEDAIVLLRTVTDREQVCTGTLVAPNLVLTSRHCVAYITVAPFVCTVQGELTDNATGGGILGADAPAEAIEVYGAETPRTQPLAVGARVVSSQSANVCKDDIAFVVLDRALDLPLAPIRVGRRTRRGELATLVGYGSDGTSSDLPWPNVPRRHLFRQSVLDIGPSSLDEGVITARPRIMVFGGPSSCYGDSGGPALSETSGAVISVLSVIDRQDCLDENVKVHYTQTSVFEALATEAFEAAGAEPRFEDDRSLGEACSENYQCASGRCLLRSEEPDVCTRNCETDSCGEGYECKETDEEALCVPKPATPCSDCKNPSPAPAPDGGCAVTSRPTTRALPAGALVLTGLLAARRRRAPGKSTLAGLVWAALFGLLFGVGACGSDEVVRGQPGDSNAGSSGTGAGSGGMSGRGGASGSGGVTDSGVDRGGSGGIDAGDGSAGTAGEASIDAATDGTGDVSTDGTTDRCLPPGSAYMLDVCRRLTTNQQLSIMSAMVPEYAGKVHDDCRVARLLDRIVPFEYLNSLQDWGYAFWGCRVEGVKTFGLAGTVTAFSVADARLLSELYVEVASLRLSMSAKEEQDMRQALECLGIRAASNPSTTVRELSKCVADSGADSAADGGADSSDATLSDVEVDVDVDVGASDSATE